MTATGYFYQPLVEDVTIVLRTHGWKWSHCWLAHICGFSWAQPSLFPLKRLLTQESAGIVARKKPVTSTSIMMSTKTPIANQVHFSSSSSSNRLQYKLIHNNRLILLNRQSIFNQFLTNRHNSNDNFCLYLHRFCLQNRLEGFNYCIRHILYDKNAPFRQCSYLNTITGKRCPNAARRLDRRDAICPWHIKKRNLELRRKEPQQPDSLRIQPEETLQDVSLKRKLEDLEHYCPEEHDHRRKYVEWDLPEDKCITASKSLRDKINESINCQNQSQSDDEAANATLSDVLNLDLVDSENESAESYMDDPLRHAGVYTAEEIAHVLRDKMLRLQTLYINLLNYYRYILKNKMRDYYINLKHERSLKFDTTLTSPIADQKKEQTDYQLLKAMHKYHNISGSERVIKNAASEIRRSLIEETDQPSTSKYSTCIFVKDTGVCNQRCIPLSSYCKSHVLYDPHQILYRPCAGGSPYCLNPVISYVHKNSCVKYVQMKFEKSDIDNILKSPTKIEVNDNNDTNDASMVDLVNDNELYSPMNDMAVLGMDPSEPGNLFSLENFYLDNADILS